MSSILIRNRWLASFHCPRPSLCVLAAVMLVRPAGAQNLLQNPGFESGTAGWSGFGAVSLTAPPTLPRTGSRSALVENRTAAWNGVAQSLLGVIQPGTNYSISAWVRLADGGSQPVLLTMLKTDSAGTSYQTIGSGTASSTAWTPLTGNFTLSVSGTLTALTLYLEGPPPGVSFYADDFAVQVATPYDWKTPANARIEQFRKRDVEFLVVDPAGRPLPDVAIAVRQTRHQFAFGSAINYHISNPNYAAFVRSNFQWAVMENESKWYANEPSRSNVTYTAANSITNFCRTNGITLRGHTLFWAVDQNVQSWVTNLSDADLRVHLTNRLNSAVNHFKGTFVHWDVNNELLHGNYFGNRLGNWVNPWMFQHARLLDPNVRLFVNDYNVVSGNETAAYKLQIQALLASNAPVDGIGAQGHFGAVVDPQSTEARLDSLAELGLPIWITEYDSLNEDEQVRADNLEKLYRIAFSKPTVEGVLMWGFWAGSHWRGSNAAIVNLDWTLNAAGQRYQALLTEWTTVTNGLTGPVGRYAFRGFHGNYDVTLTPPGGQPTLRRVKVDPGTETNLIQLVAHATGTQPVLHNPAAAEADSKFHFQLTGEAGRTYAVESSTNLAPPAWSPAATLSNQTGTLWYTNSTLPPPTRQFFRARLVP
jgi:GH35 family endo-1,4-beta-xylanase